MLSMHVSYVKTINTYPNVGKCTETIPNYVLFTFDLEASSMGIGTATFVEIVTHVACSTGALTASKLT